MKFIKDDYEVVFESLLRYGSERRFISPAAKTLRADGTPRSEIVASYQRIEFDFDFGNLTQNDYNAVLDFIINKVDWASDQFIYEDNDGRQYEVKFLTREYDFNPVDVLKREGRLTVATQAPDEGWGGWGKPTSSYCLKRFLRNGARIEPSDLGAYYYTSLNFEDDPTACWCRSAYTVSLTEDLWVQFKVDADAIDYLPSQSRTWSAPGLVFGLTAPSAARSSLYNAAKTGLFFQLRAGRATRSGISLRANFDGSWQFGQFVLMQPVERFTSTWVKISISKEGDIKVFYNDILQVEYTLSGWPRIEIGDRARIEFGAATNDLSTENFFGYLTSSSPEVVW